MKTLRVASSDSDLEQILAQALAVANGRVVGYCVALSLSLQSALPELVPMFEPFDRCRYDGMPLADDRFFVGGQVCGDHEYAASASSPVSTTRSGAPMSGLRKPREVVAILRALGFEEVRQQGSHERFRGIARLRPRSSSVELPRFG